MPNLIVCTEEGEVLYTSILQDAEKWLLRVQEEISLRQSFPPVRVNGLIVLVGPDKNPERPRPTLSACQAEVLQGLARSMTAGQIAIKIGISKSTVHMHMRLLKQKFGAESKEQMMAMAGSLGLCDPFHD